MKDDWEIGYMLSQSAISTCDLGKAFRNRQKNREINWAIRNVTLEIGHGEIVGVIGHNGSGKSTFLKLIARTIHPSQGHFAARGRVLGLLNLAGGFQTEMTGRDNIVLISSLVGMKKDDLQKKFESIVHFSQLEKFLDLEVKFYSKGMGARLVTSVILHARPDVLLVDEALSVLDQEFRGKCTERITQLAEQGTAVLLVSHDKSTIESLCMRVIEFESGMVKGT